MKRLNQQTGQALLLASAFAQLQAQVLVFQPTSVVQEPIEQGPELAEPDEVSRQASPDCFPALLLRELAGLVLIEPVQRASLVVLPD